jgi:folate-dependent phosphoribosylglycinamide formyltransferase PurN
VEDIFMERNLIVFASGTPADGGTGAENLVKRLRGRTLAVVSNHENGGVKRRIGALSIPVVYFSGPYTEAGYRHLIEKICIEANVNKDDAWFALSGWFKKVRGLPPARTFNIHPASLPRFAGAYGEKLHALVWEAYRNGEITEGEIVMHFVTERYDEGPVFFRHPFSLSGIGSYEEYRKHVRILEHNFQPVLTNCVLQGKISWNGTDPRTLRC